MRPEHEDCEATIMFPSPYDTEPPTRRWTRSSAPTVRRRRPRPIAMFAVCVISLVAGAIAGLVFDEGLARAMTATTMIAHTPRAALVTSAHGRADGVLGKLARPAPKVVVTKKKAAPATSELELAFRVTP